MRAPGPLLVVDDAELNRDMLSRRLIRQGYDVVVAEGGREAIDLVEARGVTLVLLDIEMPGVSGIEVLTTLRRRYSRIELPVIMVTARQESSDVVEALSLGANDYVTKPIDFPIVLARIETQLSLKRADAALRESEERYALAVRGANDGLWDWDLRTNEIYFSPRWKLMLGATDDQIAGHPDEWFARMHPDDAVRVRARMASHLAGEIPHFEVEHRMLHGDGTYRWMLTRGLAVRDPIGQAYRMAGSQTDVTEGKVSDALTGLPNRVLFVDRLGRSIARAARHPEAVFAVLFLDLDRFRVVNESLGHSCGDQLLVAVADRLDRCVRSSDTLARLGRDHTVARLGGDEFTILLEDIRHIGDAIRVAERIQANLALPFEVGGREVFTSASIGIATSATGYDRPEALLRDAHTAMYRAKALGKGCCEVFDTAMRDRAMARLQLETDLRRAVERQEFELHYQSIVELDTGRLRGFEALIRWPHAERGMRLPADFIPLAEETGLILPMGNWVLRQACQQMAAWQAGVDADMSLTMSVNLSARQFAQSDLSEQIIQVLHETGLPGSSLKLEITESTIVDNIDRVVDVLLRLKKLGVQLAIDDFGTGYSSLNYLHRFPIDSLKIDRSFVSGMSSDGVEIVRAIVALAHNLGLDVVAEGVETECQRARLMEWGCEFGQGYLFSRPADSMTAEAMMAPSVVVCVDDR